MPDGQIDIEDTDAILDALDDVVQEVFAFPEGMLDARALDLGCPLGLDTPALLLGGEPRGLETLAFRLRRPPGDGGGLVSRP